MNQQTHNDLTEISSGKPWEVTRRLKEYLASVTPVEEKNGTYTESQHRAWFLWLSMIAKEAENQGVTWNHVVQHTHQLKITKEGLHEMAKQLMDALWKINSIKQLKKTGHVDELIDHFTDLFAKVGLELPPFPSDEQRHLEENQGYKTGGTVPNYPEEYEEPLI